MSCEKHGYTNNVYCPACDLEQAATNSSNFPAAKDAAQKLAQRLHDWMRTLKVQSGEFMPPDVVCDYAGMRNFINAMAKVIGEDPLLTRLSELQAGLKNLLVMLPNADNERADNERIPQGFCFVRWGDIREARALLEPRT